MKVNLTLKKFELSMSFTNTTLSRINLHEWRQFDLIDIDFHPRLTVLTGANGSGKSTILSIIESNLVDGNIESYLATPVDNKSKTETRFSVSTIFEKFYPFNKRFEDPLDFEESQPVGRVEFNGGESCLISSPNPDNIQYGLTFSERPKLSGFKIGSHRPLPKYQVISDIPVSGIKPKMAFDYFRKSLSSYENGHATRWGSNAISNPISPLKQTLISFAIHGSGNKNVRAIPEVVGLFDEFQAVLENVLPKEIRFKKLEVQPPEVLVVTETGSFPVDGSSGGLMSLIQTSWQIFLFSIAHKGQFVVLMDEPENHLHPSLQREFLSMIVESFPNAQFVVVTHSPFIISSVKDSYIYALRFKELGSNEVTQPGFQGVVSERIDLENGAITASEILDEVLGVSVTMPIWAERNLMDIVEQFDKNAIDEDSVKQLRDQLRDAGLADFLPQAVTRLMK